MGGTQSQTEQSLFYLREPLLQFYLQHNPKKLNSVEKILTGFSHYGVEDGAQALNVALIKEYGMGLDVLSMKVRAKYNYSSKNPGDLKFRKGQIIEVTSSKGDWWEGRMADPEGRISVGQLPSNYVEVVEAGDVVEATKRDQEAKRLNKLFRATLELITSEFKYVQDLQVVTNIFLLPMKEQFGATLTKEIFTSWQEMLGVHEQLLVFMEKALPSEQVLQDAFGDFEPPSSLYTPPPLWSLEMETRIDMAGIGRHLDAILNLHTARTASKKPLKEEQKQLREKLITDTVTGLSKAVIQLSEFLKTAIPYIANYSVSLQTIEQLHATNPAAEALMQECGRDPRTDDLHLRDFLIKPVQRVCKYPLLLREVENVAVGKGKEAVGTALERIMLVANQVDELVVKAEKINTKALADLLPRIRPVDEPRKLGLDDPSSRLFRQSHVQVQLVPGQFAYLNLPAQPNLHAFLFTKLILICEEKTSSGLLKKGKKIYRKVQTIELANAVMASRAQAQFNNRTFVLELAREDPNGPAGFWAFTLASEAECDGWVADLEEALDITAADRARRWAVVENRLQRARTAMLEERKTMLKQTPTRSTAKSMASIVTTSSSGSETPGAPSLPARMRHRAADLNVHTRGKSSESNIMAVSGFRRPTQQMTMNQVKWELQALRNGLQRNSTESPQRV